MVVVFVRCFDVVCEVVGVELGYDVWDVYFVDMI